MELEECKIFKECYVPKQLSVKRWSELFPNAKQCNLGNRTRTTNDELQYLKNSTGILIFRL